MKGEGIKLWSMRAKRITPAQGEATGNPNPIVAATPSFHPLQHSRQATADDNEPTLASGPQLNPLQLSSCATGSTAEQNLAQSITLNNNPITAGSNGTFGTGVNPSGQSHCIVPGCRLQRGCDVPYNPYTDDAFKDETCKERVKRFKQYEKYQSPFQALRRRSESPKRRKTSHDSSVDDDSWNQDHKISQYGYKYKEPATPFSRISWLALKFFLLVRHNVDEREHLRTGVAMEALKRVIPDLNHEECVAMDMLRMHYPEPNIYKDDDEDETTEGAKLHKLHLKVCDMKAEELNAALDELRAVLSSLEYRTDGVLVEPAMEWDGAGEYPYDREEFNYTLLGAVKGECWSLFPVSKEPYETEGHAANHAAELKKYEEKQLKHAQRLIQARQDYEHRACLHQARISEATEAHRCVWELKIADIDTSHHVPVTPKQVKMKYERLGWPWPPKYQKPVDPRVTEPRYFTWWVHNLSYTDYEYAKLHIQNWQNAGLEIYEILGRPYMCGDPMSSGGQTFNPQVFAAPSPKRKVGWSSEEEEPSGSPPDLVEEQYQYLLSCSGGRGLTEAEILARALKESLKDSPAQIQQPQPRVPTPTPTIVKRRDLTDSEFAELNNQAAEWLMGPSGNKDFPYHEAYDKIIRKTEARCGERGEAENRQQSYGSAAKFYRDEVEDLPQINEMDQLQGIDEWTDIDQRIGSSPPRMDIVMDGAHAVDNRLPDISGFASRFTESFERGKSRSRSPQKRSPDRSGGIPISDTLNPEVEEDTIMPSVEVVEVADSENSENEKQLDKCKAVLDNIEVELDKGRATLDDTVNGPKSYKKFPMGLNGAYERVPDTPASLRSLSSANTVKSDYGSDTDHSPTRFANTNEGGKRSIGDILKFAGQAQNPSSYVNDRNAALKRMQDRISKHAANLGLNFGASDSSNPFRHESNRNRRSNLSQADREEVDRCIARARGAAGDDAAVENKDTSEDQLANVKTAIQGMEEGPFKKAAVLAFFNDCVGKAVVALESSAAQNETWTKEDREWKVIMESEKWLGELLKSGDVPNTRSCEAVVGKWGLHANSIETAEKKETSLSEHGPGILQEIREAFSSDSSVAGVWVDVFRGDEKKAGVKVAEVGAEDLAKEA